MSLNIEQAQYLGGATTCLIYALRYLQHRSTTNKRNRNQISTMPKGDELDHYRDKSAMENIRSKWTSQMLIPAAIGLIGLFGMLYGYFTQNYELRNFFLVPTLAHGTELIILSIRSSS